MTSTNETLASVREVNLMYLQLAQRLLVSEPETARRLLGLTEDVAQAIGQLTVAQIGRLASSTHILCFFRMTSYDLLAGLAGKVSNAELAARAAAAAPQSPSTAIA
jgi:flagellar transcriptional activator FlhD